MKNFYPPMFGYGAGFYAKENAADLVEHLTNHLTNGTFLAALFRVIGCFYFSFLLQS